MRRFGAEPLARSLVPVTLQDTSETLPRHFPRRFLTPPPHNHLPDPLSAFFQTPPSVPARSRTPDPEGPSPSPTNCRPSRTRETASLSESFSHTIVLCVAPVPRQVCDNLQALCGSLEGSEVPAALLEGAVLTRESMQAALERR